VNIASIAYRRALHAGSPLRGAWSRLRRSLISLRGDPPCEMFVHGRVLRMPLSHELPTYLYHHPLYDSLPGRLGRHLRGDATRISLIDVGANIGDSIAAFGVVAGDRVLAIEPNPRFSRFLLKNWPDSSIVTFTDCLCSSGPEDGDYVIDEHAGTASIRPGVNGARMRRMPIDMLVQEFPEFGAANLLKIDTDGHDLEVLSGAEGFIRRARPVVLFECDVFGRADYTTAVQARLQAFRECGYENLIAYDHLGYLMGRHALHDWPAISRLLLYQLIAPRRYFDLVLIPEPEGTAFYAKEVEFFVQARVPAALRATALAAAGEVLAHSRVRPPTPEQSR
jgi:FkbM family methyltransferase